MLKASLGREARGIASCDVRDNYGEILSLNGESLAIIMGFD
jgi:hypothetical protein